MGVVRRAPLLARQRRQAHGVGTASIVLGLVLLLAWAITTSGGFQTVGAHPSYAIIPIGQSGAADPSHYELESQGGSGTGVFDIGPILNSQTIIFGSSDESLAPSDIPQTATASLFPLPKFGVFVQDRRNKLQIYAAILKCLLSDALGITEIALFCRLNFKSAKEMVDFLVAKGLLEAIVMEDDIRYATTPKGLLALHDIEKVTDLLQTS